MLKVLIFIFAFFGSKSFAEDIGIQFQFLCKMEKSYSIDWSASDVPKLKQIEMDERTDVHFRIVRDNDRDELHYYDTTNGFIFTLNREPNNTSNKNLVYEERGDSWARTFLINYISGFNNKQVFELRILLDSNTFNRKALDVFIFTCSPREWKF